jgi:hypothetical protein
MAPYARDTADPIQPWHPAMQFIPDSDTLSIIFTHATAPAFFLGAVAAFIALMSGRLTDLAARIRAHVDAHPDRQERQSDRYFLGLKRRVRTLNQGIMLSLISGICATLLLAILFVSQLFHWSHAWGAPLLFIAATLLLGAALFRFMQEVFSAYRDWDEF